MSTTPEPNVRDHYERANLGEAILEALRESGVAIDDLRPEDLAPVDQFHIGARDTTVQLATLARIVEGEHVLDIGGGIGGPARTLATENGCHVTVLDLCEEYCATGEMLTHRTGLADRVTFRHGSALKVPFEDDSFDVAWMQHCNMNVADKRRLFEEATRVVRPGGRLALHEICSGAERPIRFPVPWAGEASISFLESPERLRALLALDLGLEELAWEDHSVAAHSWFLERLATIAEAGGPPPVGLHILLGPQAGDKLQNVATNLGEGRIEVIQAVFRNPEAAA